MANENNFVVYMHKTPNNKVYIGLTSMIPERRWANGMGYYKNPHFTNAIKKYGWDNIEHIILFDGLTKQEACEKEIELIKLYDSTNRQKGYNIGTGGEFGATGVKKSKEFCEMVSKRHKGKVLSEETKRKILETRKERGITFKGKNNPFYNKHHTPETMLKLYKKIDVYTVGGEFIGTFESLKYVSEKFDADMSSISASCRKENRTSKGYVFRYSGDDFDYVPYTAWNRKPVIQKSINGEFIAEFECSRVAQETLKLPTNANISIRDCCRGKQKTAYGYKWEYKE